MSARLFPWLLTGMMIAVPVCAQEVPVGHGVVFDPVDSPLPLVAPLDAPPAGEAAVLGDDLALRASASPLETFRRARQFQLELRELGTPGAVIDGDAQRPDGRTSETRLQIDPTLAMRLSAREQTANTGERPSTSFTARLDWQPGGELTVDALLERTGGSSDSLRLMGHLTWRLAPARFSYEWQQVQQAGLTSQFERLATVIEPLTFGPFTLDLYGRLDRRSTQGGATTGSDLLGGNLRVSFGSTTLWLRHESNGRDGSEGRDGLSTVQLNVIPFERTSLRFTFDSSQKSNGAYAQGVTADLRIQASQTLNVLAGFEVRDGFNGAANGYDRLSERLTFGFSWPSLEFKYSRSFAVPGQTGNDTVTFSVNSNF